MAFLIDGDTAGLRRAKATAAGVTRKSSDLVASASQTVSSGERSTWKPAYGVHPAGWTFPSGFPDYFRHDPKPKE
jgi:hypothetical protein